MVASAAEAEQVVDVVSANLRSSAKLLAPNDILSDFDNGKSETSVIVQLQPTVEARDLAVKSKISAQLPAEFARPNAPTYYNLQDESIRTQLKDTVAKAVSNAINRLGTDGMTVTRRFTYIFGFAARVTPAALERIVALPEVVVVEKDAILQAHLAQGIPLLNGSTVRNTYTGSGISIAICDTGIDSSHPRLGGGGFPNAKVIGGYDTGDNDADPRPDSVNGHYHGTSCAGIAAGNTGTVEDYIGGVAPDAKLYAIKISSGNGGSASNSAMIAGWEWAVSHRNDDPNNPILIISTSFGGGKFTSTCDSEAPAMTTAAANAVAAGITLFVSSGNDGYCDSMGWPACISYVNSVGAVYDGALGTYGFCVNSASCAPKEGYPSCDTGYISWDATASNKVTSYSNSASFLTLFAPSHDAYTTDIVGPGGANSGDYDPNFGGTSAACPYAAGSAAVLQQAAREKTGSYLTPADVKNYLVSNGDNVTDGKVAITKPRINLGQAVVALPSTFAVVSTVPADGSTGVAINTPITATFNKEVAASTIISPATTFTLKAGGVNVAGSVGYNSSTRTATFSPSASLAFNTLYTATITNGVTDTTGHTLAAKVWSFTTGADEATLLTESFTTAGLPAGWTVTDNAGTGAVWVFNDPGQRGNLTGGAGGFAIADSDHAGQFNMDTELRTPLLDLTNFSNPVLKFKTYFHRYQSEVADVDVSINGASGPWTNVWRKSLADYTGSETVDISSLAAGKANVMIRFRYYNANYEWYWEVDDVVITAVNNPVLPPVRIPGVGEYDSLQAAYNLAPSSCTIQSRAVALTASPFTLSLGKTILLEGGYDSGYSAQSGYTTLQGILTLGTGTLTLENLIIK
jgi:subtilisin family serine protease